MSNILERHLEQNIDPTNQTRESYIDQAIQIFTDMKEEDITKDPMEFKSGNQYCLNGLFSRMTGYNGPDRFSADAQSKLGYKTSFDLTQIHQEYTFWHTIKTFEEMKQKAIQYMESLKCQK